jgi:hypothetical protein
MLKGNTAHHTAMYNVSYGEVVDSLQGVFGSQY